MKLNKIIFAIAVPVLALLAACQPESDVLSQISTDKGVYEIGAAGGDITVKLFSTEDWTAKVAPATSLDEVDGITVSPASGSASDKEQTVTIKVPNNAGYNRAALVSFLGSRLSSAVTVSQPGAEGERVLKVTCAEFLEKSVDASVFYEITGTVTKITDEYYNDFWINDGTVEGDGVYTYGLFESKGASRINYYMQQMDIREGDILTMRATRSAYNGQPQAGSAYYVSHEKSKTPSIALGLEKYEAGATGETFELPVTSNVVTWTLSADVDWLSFDPATGNASTTVKVTVAAGPDAEGTITLAAAGLESKTCKVIRSAVPVLTVSEILGLEKGALLSTKPSLVVAKTTKGFVISDGTKAVYVFDNGANAVAIGDMITFKGSKTVYNGVHEIEKVSNLAVESNGNAVTYPNPKYVVDYAAEYTAEEAEFVTICGKLKVSGNYLNVELEGVDSASKMGSIVYPVDDLNAKSFDGKDIIINGYFNGWSGGNKYLNVIAVSIAEYTPGAKGTYTNPYRPSEIAPILGGGTKISGNVFVTGKVSKIASQFSSGYGNAQFWISDDGAFKSDPNQDFEAYNAWYLGNRRWVEGDQTVSEGDVVVLYGEVTYFSKNSVAETNGKRAYVHTINGQWK
ncbi:MAG: BACON domain-containing protein [Bacteroidales bacterium]|nr:BACON domain-containing protein [Bacteroidales bacterium]